MPERRLPRTGYGAGLVCSLGSNAVLAPANGNEMLVFHGMQQHLDLLWLNVKKFLLTQSLGGQMPAELGLQVSRVMVVLVVIAIDDNFGNSGMRAFLEIIG